MIYTCVNFTGYWPIGTSAVVEASDELQAAYFLNEKLKEQGLLGDAKPEDMTPFSREVGSVRILCDGNY